jgi:2-methylisocitrate lyase-like PEP mutase family enzyme
MKFGRVQRIVLRCRFLVEDVERGAGDAVCLQRVIKRRLVDDAAARRVDDESGPLHVRQPRRVEEPDRLGGFRAMDRDEIGPRDSGVEVLHRLVA